MKKVVLVIFFLFVVLVVSIWIRRHQKSQQDIGHEIFCTRLEQLKIIDRRPAVVPAYKLAWEHNQQLAVYFYDCPPLIKKKVIKIANEWANHCGMSFKDTTRPWLAKIRVSFRGKEYASAVGRECIDAKYLLKPNMYLGGLDTMSNESNFKRIVLHEFGHALGLEHELKNPNLNIPWDTAAVYKYYKDHYGWDESKTRKNVFNSVLIEQYKRYDEFDSTSIMIYALPDTLTKGKFKIDWPVDLSPTDKIGIGKWYPKSTTN